MSIIISSKPIREFRKQNKLSVIQLSREMNVSTACVYNWENGSGISVMRLRNWLLDPDTPDHIRELARKMLSDDRAH
jgi:predicted transcriptional regulator